MKKDTKNDLFKAIQAQTDAPAAAAEPTMSHMGDNGEIITPQNPADIQAGYGLKIGKEPKSERFSFVMRKSTLEELDKILKVKNEKRNILVHALIDAYILNYDIINPYVEAVLETEPRANNNK